MHKKIEEELHGLPENFIVLTLVNSENAEKANLALLNHLVNIKGHRGNYVTVSRPYSNIVQVLQNNNIDPNMLFFIDCISKDMRSDVDAHNCVYIDSPQHLTDISIAVQELIDIKHGDFLVIDSINTLSIYNDKERLMRFMHFITNKIRIHELKGVMVSLHKGTDPEMLAQLSQFCDKVIDLCDD